MTENTKRKFFVGDGARFCQVNEQDGVRRLVYIADKYKNDTTRLNKGDIISFQNGMFGVVEAEGKTGAVMLQWSSLWNKQLKF